MLQIELNKILGPPIAITRYHNYAIVHEFQRGNIRLCVYMENNRVISLMVLEDQHEMALLESWKLNAPNQKIIDFINKYYFYPRIGDII